MEIDDHLNQLLRPLRLQVRPSNAEENQVEAQQDYVLNEEEMQEIHHATPAVSVEVEDQ